MLDCMKFQSHITSLLLLNAFEWVSMPLVGLLNYAINFFLSNQPKGAP